MDATGLSLLTCLICAWCCLVASICSMSLHSIKFKDSFLPFAQLLLFFAVPSLSLSTSPNQIMSLRSPSFHSSSQFSRRPLHSTNTFCKKSGLKNIFSSRHLQPHSIILYSHDMVNRNEDAVQLQYSEFSPPESSSLHPPVILLHGLLGNKRNFASLASSLSSQLSKPRPIYTVDLRNHGENTHDWRHSMTYSEMARDVAAFMDKISEESGHSKAVIVGHSMGGKVAQSLALMYPERVAGLVILDIAPVRYSSDEKDSSWKTVEEIVRSVAQLDLDERGFKTKREVDSALRDVCTMLEDPALRAFVLTNLGQQRSKSESSLKWNIHWEGIVNQLDKIAGFDAHDQPLDELPLISNPSTGNNSTESSSSDIVTMPSYKYEGDVFFIHGGASRFVRHSHISSIATFFPNHMLTTIRGAGHWVHAEAPDDTIALLKKYLDR